MNLSAMWLRCLASVCCLTLGLYAAYPDVTRTEPNGGQRGTEFKVTLTGQRLGDFEDLIFFSPGIKVKSVESTTSTKVELTLSIAADVPPGNHVMRVRTKTGISHPRQFFVGIYPNVAEKEPNDTMATAQPVQLNQTIEGVIRAEDVDYFKVPMKKGQRLSIEIEGLRLGYGVFDPYIAIVDKDRFEKAFSDDTILHRQDGYCSYVADYDGDYYVMVRESSYQGSENAHYRLHIGSFRRPDVVFPGGGRLGSKLKVSFIDGKESFSEEVTLPTTENPGFQLFAHSQDPAPSGNPFRLSPFENTFEVEPNDTREQATVVPPADAYALNGIIDKPGDVDYFKITLKKGQVLEGHCYAQALGSPLDPTVRITSVSGAELISNDDGGGMHRLDSQFKVTVPADGDYYVRIRDHLERGGPNYVYRLELVASVPRLTFASPDYTVNDTQYRQFMAVPRGGRMALLENFTRNGVSGDYRFEASGLPAGVKLLNEAAPKDMPNMPLVFEAATDAPLGQAVVPLRMQPLDGKNKVVGVLRQTYDIVRNGNVIYYQGILDAVPVAVVESVPYDLIIEQPKVPVVQNGVLDLKVIAKRKDGFKAPIRVFMVWTPPGITALGEQTIAADATECVFQLNATAGVSTGDWSFVVMGEAEAGNGRMYNASPFAKVSSIPALVAANAIPLTSIEQGQEARAVTNFEVLQPFEGEAVARLVGVPETILIPPVKVTKDTKELAFVVKTTKDSPLGKQANLFVQVEVPLKAGGTTTHRIALGSMIRVDAPRKAAPAPVASTSTPAKPVDPKAPPAPALSRLEQLRQKNEPPKN
jgi:hypothetical protein